MRGVPKAFWSVHSAPQPLLSRIWTAWAGGRAQGVAGLGQQQRLAEHGRGEQQLTADEAENAGP